MNLQDLSHATFYDMGSYSQYVIDAVQEIEDEIQEYTEDEKGAKRYELNNVLSLIDKDRTKDRQALESLIAILKNE